MSGADRTGKLLKNFDESLMSFPFPIAGIMSMIIWHQLPPLPDPCGFAGPFVGVIGPDLLVAGGANFPDKQVWEGGTKTWHDRIFELAPGAPGWRLAGRLRSPLAYGLSISTAEGVLCAGGSDSEKFHREVFLIQSRDGVVSFRDLPSLPQPVAMGAGAQVGHVIYLAGGQGAAGTKERLRTFFALDLQDLPSGWRTLPSWPGPERSFAVAASAGGYFYLFSGLRHVAVGVDGRNEYLKDAYRYSPAGGWERLPDLPRAAVAGPTPAPVTGDAIFLFGGLDGSGDSAPYQEFLPPPRTIQSLAIGAKSWTETGKSPAARICQATAQWQGEWIFPSGERSPGIRSPEVWAAGFR